MMLILFEAHLEVVAGGELINSSSVGVSNNLSNPSFEVLKLSVTGVEGGVADPIQHGVSMTLS